MTEVGESLRSRIVNDFKPNDTVFDVFRNILDKDKKPGVPRFECPVCAQHVYGHLESATKKNPTNIYCGECWESPRAEVVKMVFKPVERAGE